MEHTENCLAEKGLDWFFHHLYPDHKEKTSRCYREREREIERERESVKNKQHPAEEKTPCCLWKAKAMILYLHSATRVVRSITVTTWNSRRAHSGHIWKTLLFNRSEWNISTTNSRHCRLPANYMKDSNVESGHRNNQTLSQSSPAKKHLEEKIKHICQNATSLMSNAEIVLRKVASTVFNHIVANPYPMC